MTDLRTRSHTQSAAGDRARRLRRAACLAAAAAALLLTSAAPAFAQSNSLLWIAGRGWGHGIGMSQWGAYGYAVHGWKYDAIIKHYYTGVSLGKVSNSTIRVLLAQSKTTVSVTSTSSYHAAVGTNKMSIPANTTAVVSWSAGEYRITAGSVVKHYASPVTFSPGTAKLKLLNSNLNGEVHRYRGALRVIHYTGGFTVVNKLPLESYLYGVVPREVGSSWPVESLKAQAVAARSYAARAVGGSGAFDVYCTTASQMYGGVDSEATTTTAAVNATKGIVPKYAGKPITAFFFSTSGGHTENIENVWATSPQPYLKGVSDPYEPPYNAKTGSGAIYHVWRDNPIKFTPASVLNHLGIYTIANPLGVKGLFKTIYVVKRGTSPRVVTAYIVGDQGVTAIRGSTLGIKLGLRDSWAHFTSLSISPAAADKYAMNFGGGFALSGRMYPAVATGTKVTLHYYRDAVWQTMSMKTVRGQQALADGYTAHYSGYSFNAHPPKTTEYYITYGAYASPHTTVYVRPVLTIASATTTVKASDSLTFTGGVTPAMPGRTVYLQTKTGTTWTDAGSAKLTDASAYSISWTALAGGTAARVRIANGAGLASGNSPALTLTVN
jgi:stage II sporulation protein D